MKLDSGEAGWPGGLDKARQLAPANMDPIYFPRRHLSDPWAILGCFLVHGVILDTPQIVKISEMYGHLDLWVVWGSMVVLFWDRLWAPG